MKPFKTFKLRGPEAREAIARALAAERGLVSGRDLERLDYLEPLLHRHLDRGGDHAAIAAYLLVACDPNRRLRLELAVDIALRRGADAEGELADRNKQAKNAAPGGGKAKHANRAAETAEPLREMLDKAAALKRDGVVRKSAAGKLHEEYGAYWSENRIYRLIGDANGGPWPRGEPEQRC